MMASVFIATSLDGFIARSDGGLDWLPADGGEPHGYEEFIATVDAIVIGLKTFEIVLAFESGLLNLGEYSPAVPLALSFVAGFAERLFVRRLERLIG